MSTALYSRHPMTLEWLASDLIEHKWIEVPATEETPSRFFDSPMGGNIEAWQYGDYVHVRSHVEEMPDFRQWITADESDWPDYEIKREWYAWSIERLYNSREEVDDLGDEERRLLRKLFEGLHRKDAEWIIAEIDCAKGAGDKASDILEWLNAMHFDMYGRPLIPVVVIAP